MKNHNPFILNLYKPEGMSSQNTIRVWKKRLKEYGKVGHFGTLDPFAEGVLMLGVAGAQRLNEYIHECLPKTYLAKGILGKETPTGDLTVDPTQIDDSKYLRTVISNFDLPFIQETLEKKFLGDYWQAPHIYSAAKFEGQALHQWARQGVEIKKEKKLRHIYKLEVVKYDFPQLWIRFQVSSGTYIRTLFSDCAKELGTIGVLKSLIREEVGGCNLKNCLYQEDWHHEDYKKLSIEEVLPFGKIIFAEKELRLYNNGVRLNEDRIQRKISAKLSFPYYWACSEDEIVHGLCEITDDGEIKSKVNFLL